MKPKSRTRTAPKKTRGSGIPAARKPAVRKTALRKRAPQRVPLKPGPGGVVLLSGGNPQIAKGEGDAPVQAYIAAMPGWKRATGERLDAIIGATVPKVRKAVKWNSPFYGAEAGGWFASYHCFNAFIKVTFFRGSSLRPPPPGKSRYPAVRYLDIHEGELDEARFADWIAQASKLPGEML